VRYPLSVRYSPRHTMDFCHGELRGSEMTVGESVTQSSDAALDDDVSQPVNSATVFDESLAAESSEHGDVLFNELTTCV